MGSTAREKGRKRCEGAWWRKSQRQKRPKYTRSGGDKSYTCRPCAKSWPDNGLGGEEVAAKCWQINCVLDYSNLPKREQVRTLYAYSTLYTKLGLQ